MWPWMLGAVIFLTACIADPWPEPDESAPYAPSGEWQNGSDSDADVDADIDTAGDAEEDVDTGDIIRTDSDTADYEGDDTAPILDQVYCSAPDSEGVITVTGLAGTVLDYEAVFIRRDSDLYGVVVGEDGGFSRRLPAAAGDVIEVVIQQRTGEMSTRLTVTAAAVDELATNLAGPGLSVDSQGGDVVVRGDGAALREGDRVVGANRDISTGRIAVVSCNDAGCLFDLLIPGNPGDVVDLFLVTADERAGYSAPFAVTVE